MSEADGGPRSLKEIGADSMYAGQWLVIEITGYDPLTFASSEGIVLASNLDDALAAKDAIGLIEGRDPMPRLHILKSRAYPTPLDSPEQ